jgi:hypothetical protein
MLYNITPWTHRQARRLGVEVKPSRREGKKIDVYRDGERLGSVGAKGYNDYGMYLEEDGPFYANQRRKLYRLRHTKGKKDSPSWLAWSLLW